MGSKALNSVDGKLVTDAASYQAVTWALGKVIASVPTSQVMDVYNAVGKITGSSVPNQLFSMSAPGEAVAAYDALMQFKDVVKAAQRLAVRNAALCSPLHLGTFFRRTVVGCPNVWFDVQRLPGMYRHRTEPAEAFCRSTLRVRCADLGYQDVKFAV